jgi:hypothetical protein
MAVKLGEMLVEHGVVSQAQLDEALTVQQKDGGLIGVILVNLGHLDEPTLLKYLSMQAERVVKSE